MRSQPSALLHSGMLKNGGWGGGAAVWEAELLARLVEAHGRVAVRAADVPHVTEQIACGVLRDGSAQVEAEAPVGERRLAPSVTLDGHAAHEQEAAAATEHDE